jgi:hypothetical protein
MPAMAIIADAPIAAVTGFKDIDSSLGGSFAVFIIVEEGSRNRKKTQK